MNFDLDEDQSMLADTVNRLLADRYGFEDRRRLVATPSGWSADLWAQLAELGVLAAPFAEADGGLDGGPVETMVVGQALGRVLSAEPYLATIVMAGAALRLSDNHALRAALVPQVVSGELILAVAPDIGDLVALPAPGGWLVDGQARGVIHGDSAQGLVLSAASAEGLVLLLVDTTAPGVTVAGHRTFDGLRAADLTLQGVAVAGDRVLAVGPAAEALMERVVQHAIAYLAAEAVGIMEMLLEITVEHLRTRQQFGQALARFQALQHRAAEMLVSLEQARSMALYAAMMVEDADPLERRKAFAAIKAVISTSSRFVGQSAVQLHGGIGVTEEHRAGWGLKRLTMIDMLFGDADSQAARLARLGGFVEAA